MQDTSIRTLNTIFFLLSSQYFGLHCIGGIEISAFQHALKWTSGHSAMQEKIS